MIAATRCRLRVREDELELLAQIEGEVAVDVGIYAAVQHGEHV